MFGFGILSGLIVLPLVGSAFILVLRGEDEATLQNARWAALITTIVNFLLVLLGLGAFRSVDLGLPVRRAARVVRRGPVLQARRRRHVVSLRRADDLPDAVLHPRLVAVDPLPGEGIHDRLPGPRDLDDRRLLLARPRPLLPVLRGRPDPDVPDHRHLGRHGRKRLCGVQVLPLHADRLAAHAARHHGDVCLRRHDRHHGAAADAFPGLDADVAVARLLRLVRREDADVAGPHLAPRRACRGADGRAR